MNCYSFDVFDTCLCRLCGEPRNLFEVLSLRLKALMGCSCTEHMRQLFVAARINSSGHNLNEIYHNVAKLFPLPCGIEEMTQLELDTERDMLVPVLATKKLIEELRQKGDILFISDMYLPADFIREQLIRHGFFHEGDRLYVSDSVGAWKYDGTLFQLVHEREDVPYRKWHHYGDNLHSDYKVPRHLGIHAHRLHYDYLHYEEQWMRQSVVGFQYASIMAGISRAVRLQSETPENQTRFVANLSAPFMISWVVNLLQDARQRGIRRLYFLARDVHSEYLIAKRFSEMYPEIEVRYLIMSSNALYNSKLCELFLRENGFTDDMPVAVVDSNTSGKTLQTMNDMLDKDLQNAIYGYFILKRDLPEYRCCFAGNYLLNSFYLDAMASKRIRRTLGMRIFFELLFSLNYHPTTVDYEYHGQKLRPVFGEDGNDNWCFDNMTSRLAKRSNDAILLSYADAFRLSGLAAYTNEIMERLALPTLIDFVDRPRKEYLDYLHHFIWWGKPFVGKNHGSKKGVWKRGNHAYVLPSWIINSYYLLISSQSFRKKTIRLFSWIPFR